MPFQQALPFSLTEGQQHAIAEIQESLNGSVPMNRLLQGDVGSGKTVVAAAACYIAIQNGLQCALMAPTEILASQHMHTMQAFLAPLGISVALLASSNPIGTIFSAAFISHITTGGGFMDTNVFPPEIADVISGVVIYLCAFSLLFKNWFTKKLGRRKEETAAAASAASPGEEADTGKEDDAQ